MVKDADFWIKYVADEIKKELGDGVTIFLFGSRANGKAKKI